MKKSVIYSAIIASALIVLAAIPAGAQRFELTPFAGYHTSGKINSYKGYFRVTDGLSYGGTFDFGSSTGYKLEVSYDRMNSYLSFTDNGTTTGVCNLAISYISIGGVVNINPENMVVPFGKVAIGGTYYTPIDNSTIGSENIMHFDISGGAKIFFNSHVGLRFQASLLLPVFFEGMYFDEAVPQEGQGMKTKISGIQGDFTAGVAFRF